MSEFTGEKLLLIEQTVKTEYFSFLFLLVPLKHCCTMNRSFQLGIRRSKKKRSTINYLI